MGRVAVARRGAGRRERPVNVIILARDDASHVLPTEPGAVVVVGVDVAAGLERLRARVTTSSWRILRTDRWHYDTRVIDELRRVGQLPGVELIDPTGLLGGSRYGFDINREESAPIVQRTRFKTRSPTEPPAPKSKRGGQT